MVPLSVAAESGIARAWKKFDNWLLRSQLMGIDTNYVQLPKLNHQAYIGSYTYWQGYQMTMPFFMEDATTILPGIKDKDHYRLNAYTWGLAKNGSIWGARFRYKHLRQMDGNCNVGDLSLNNDKNNINIFFIEGYYVLMHKKFSLSAGLYADMVQRRSAGSPLIYLNYYHSSYNLENLFPANYDSFRTNQVSLGLGYAYNLSFLQGRLVFHASVVPMFSIYNHLKHRVGHSSTFFTSREQNEEAKAAAKAASGLTEEQWNAFYNAADNGSARFRVNAFARFAVNYSFNRFIVSFLANYRHYAYSNDLNLQIRNQEADMQFNVCVRF